MKTIHIFLAMTVLTIGLYTAQVFAEETQKGYQTTAESKIQVLDQKIATIQLQIDKLEKKGVENFSDKEFVIYEELSDKLLVTMQLKTAQQKKIIAEENKKQEKEKAKQNALDRVSEQLDSIQGALSSTDSIN